LRGKNSDDLTVFRQIDAPRASDMIIEQIQELISGGVLKRGMRLPSERDLAARFGVGRGPVREALKKMEFYGLVRAESQRGYFIAEIGEKALQGLISTMLRGGNHDMNSLFETREILETHAVRLAAERAGDEEIASIRNAHDDFEAVVNSGGLALEEDHLFHLAIARSTRNPVLTSLLGYLTPEIIRMNRDVSRREISDRRSREETVREHLRIVLALERRDAAEAEEAMRSHMYKLKARRFSHIEETTDE
jgi:GntR family transcriptional regulator, transcriptional repressor for pyruvate dehydrogenase complex